MAIIVIACRSLRELRISNVMCVYIYEKLKHLEGHRCSINNGCSKSLFFLSLFSVYSLKNVLYICFNYHVFIMMHDAKYLL